MSLLTRGILSAVLVGGFSPPVAYASPDTSAQPGRPHPRETHVYVGMWTTHLNANRLHVDSNNVTLGVAHGPVFAATFVNSFGNRAYAAGWQKSLLAGRGRWLAGSLGIRLGAISGYDERFLSFAKDAAVIPMVSVYSRVELTRLGVEVSWTAVVASAALSVRF
ncbi:MAG: hypothetical protein EPO35_11020 [Acidobacteria bacterium]|nr:MAG: hypothetical protein EPO35_11020 [Acidobacteriota bacterium]